MIKLFINRPVLATVISILLVMLGILGLFTLPIQQFPDIAPPSVQVTANYPGANAETILRSVVPQLEEAINGVENMSYITSTASNDGSLNITVFFNPGTDPDQATVNVQNRVSQALSQLPSEVVQLGINVVKQQNTFIMALNMYAEDGAPYDQTFIANYANINILPEIKRIPGVGVVALAGASKDYAMRIWLNPAQMATYELTPQEVTAAIQDQNLEAAPGRFGENSKEAFEYVIKYKGKYNQVEDYEQIVIRANPDGSILRLKDVARVEMGSFSYSSFNLINGRPGVVMRVIQTPGSNANEIQVAVQELMEKAKKDFPKGIHYMVQYSTKAALDRSIDQVITTLIEAFVLVFVVVFLFLQDFRSTLIPAIAVPVSIVGTFFFMQAFGFSINLITLFALILAIGIVVDDAIVVVEAVHAKMEQTGMAARQATVSALGEISGAVVSITLVMSAVFVPVGFMTGASGLFYRQFALTLAIAIVISAVNALTLSPALCALFLRSHQVQGADGHGKRRGVLARFFAAFNAGFEGLTNKYLRVVGFFIRFKWLAIVALLAVSGLTYMMLKTTKQGFIPAEDRSFATINLAMPPGSSLDRTTEVMKQAAAILKEMPSIKVVSILSGLNGLTGSNSSSAGTAFMLFKPIEERGEMQDLNEIMNDVRKRLSVIKDGTIFAFTPPTIPGFGNVDGLTFVLQDRTGGPLSRFGDAANNFITELKKRPEIGDAFTPFKANYPQYELVVDNAKAKQLGVNVKDIIQTMQAYFGAALASDFNRFGKFYRVVVQADPAARTDVAALESVRVRNKLGEMVPLSSLVELRRVLGPETVSRYNLFTSISVNALTKGGFSSGDAIRAIEEVAAATLPQGYSYEFSGLTREEIASGGQSAIIFALCILFVYFLLAAQYESYILPLSVLLSIPTGIFGVFLAIRWAGIDNNIYVQVALVMLIGLLAKNAILIVEYAVQRRRAGLSLHDAALEAARLRLRPILMTSLAFVVGLIPMMRAKGPSALGNHSISIGAAGGMVAGVVLGVLLIPILFILFQYLQEKVSGKPRPVDDASSHS